MTTPTPVTLDEFKAHLNKTGDVDNGELVWMLEAATEAVEGWHGIGPLVARQFNERVQVECGHAVLTKTPVRSVTSLTRVTDGLEYLTAALDVDEASGIVEGLSSRFQPGKYMAVYDAGRDPVPVSLLEATLIIGKHLWESQRGPKSKLRGGDDESRAQWAGAGYLIPNRAAHLMQPFVSVPVG
jgi:hypothetical protein